MSSQEPTSAGKVVARPTSSCSSPDLPTDSDDDLSSSSSSSEAHDSDATDDNFTEEEDAAFARTRYLERQKKDDPDTLDEDSFTRKRYDLLAVQERMSVQSDLYDTMYSPRHDPDRESSPPISRAHLRLALWTLRARQILGWAAERKDNKEREPFFGRLYNALGAVSDSLPPREPALLAMFARPTQLSSIETANAKPNFGVFVPVLARLVRDVRALLLEEEETGKEARKGMSKDDARAVVMLRQRWLPTPSPEVGKGRAAKREEDAYDWVLVVERLAAENPPPLCLSDSNSPSATDPALVPATSSLLTSLEQLLLPSALPRLSLSYLSLTSLQLARWDALEKVEEVVRWYIGFSYARGDEELVRRKAREVLSGVKVLDLSFNRLTDLPSNLPLLFPNLQALSLSHNRFTRVPPLITSFSHLRRLATGRNRLVDPRKALKPVPGGTGSTLDGKTGADKAKGRGKKQKKKKEEEEKKKEPPEEGAHKTGVRANVKEVYPRVKEGLTRLVKEVTMAEVLAFAKRPAPTPTPAEDATATENGERTAAASRGVPSLFSLAAQLAQAQLSASAASQSPNTAEQGEVSSTTISPSSPDPGLPLLLPPHLATILSSSYSCTSCGRFVLGGGESPSMRSCWFVPPFWERVHFLSPGILIPFDAGASPSSEQATRERKSRWQAKLGKLLKEEKIEQLESAGYEYYQSGNATLEQRLVLAVLAREEPPPLPSTRRDQYGFFGSYYDDDDDDWYAYEYDRLRRLSSSSNSPPLTPPPPPPPSPVIPTYALGGTGASALDHRFCTLCAAYHLRAYEPIRETIRLAIQLRHRREKGGGEEGVGGGVELGREAWSLQTVQRLAEWRCWCVVCKEERRLRGTSEPEDGAAGGVKEEEGDEDPQVVRWLRRYDAPAR
ncbi:hypothetical protein JCM10908_003719 [Rhodotorula pacifica]|uniref:leucine-rich repeat domain-containing protein n=1 Tax=Rhodotorula pacifica TaxID=1495444 RepID=UPI003178D10E